MALTWAVIGAGDIARRHTVPALLRTPGHQLRAVMRRNADKAERFARDFGVARWYSDVEGLLGEPSIDAVYIATPPASHAELTLRAAAAGKHVLCEKPIACSPAEARIMINACERAGVRLMVCHYQRFNQRHRRIREWIAAGTLGRILSARINFSSYSPPEPGQWRFDRAASGGGPLMDLGSHSLDLLMFFRGRPDWSNSLVHFPEAGGVEDGATLLLRFPGGTHAVVTTYWSARVPDEVADNAVHLWGAEASVTAAPVFSKDSSGSLMLYTSDGAQDHSMAAGTPVHQALLENFRMAIETGEPVGAPPEDALAGLEIIERAYGRL